MGRIPGNSWIPGLGRVRGREIPKGFSLEFPFGILGNPVRFWGGIFGIFLWNSWEMSLGFSFGNPLEFLEDFPVEFSGESCGIFGGEILGFSFGIPGYSEGFLGDFPWEFLWELGNFPVEFLGDSFGIFLWDFSWGLIWNS